MSESTAAAERRADYVRALNEERAMCERAGKTDRVAAIDAELERAQGAPQQRHSAPQESAAPSTPSAAKKSASQRRRG